MSRIYNEGFIIKYILDDLPSNDDKFDVIRKRIETLKEYSKNDTASFYGAVLNIGTRANEEDNEYDDIKNIILNNETTPNDIKVWLRLN